MVKLWKEWWGLFLLFGWISLIAIAQLYYQSKKNELIVAALDGNKWAVKILIKHKKTDKLNYDIVKAALDGNINAIEILGIQDD